MEIWAVGSYLPRFWTLPDSPDANPSVEAGKPERIDARCEPLCDSLEVSEMRVVFKKIGVPSFFSNFMFEFANYCAIHVCLLPQHMSI